MKPIYIWVRDYKNIHNMGFLLDDRYTVNYTEDIILSRLKGITTGSILKISRNENTVKPDIYPKNIVNLKSFVGKNGTGKSAILELLSMGYNSSRVYKGSYFIVYSTSTDNEFIIEGDIDEFNFDFFNSFLDLEDREFSPPFAVVYNSESNMINRVIQQSEMRNLFNNIQVVLIKASVGEYYDHSEIFTKKARVDYSDYSSLSVARFLSEHLSRNESLKDYFKFAQFELSLNKFEFRDHEAPFDFIRNDYLRTQLYLRSSEADRLRIDTRVYVVNFLFRQFIDKLMYKNTIFFKGLDIINGFKENLVKFLKDFGIYSKLEDGTEIDDIFNKDHKDVRLPLQKINRLLLSVTIKYSSEELGMTPDEFKDSIVDKDQLESLIEILLRYLSYVDPNIDIEIGKNTFLNGIDLFNRNRTQIGKIKCNLLSINSEILELIDVIEYHMSRTESPFNTLCERIQCNLLKLSDGENYFIRLYSTIIKIVKSENINHMTLLFDEVELYFHPEWSRLCLYTLFEILNDFDQINFSVFFATHSPFIITDMLVDDIFFLKRDDEGFCCIEEVELDNTFGMNIHDLFKQGMFLNATVGEFSVKVIGDLTDELLKLKELNESNRIDDISLNEKVKLLQKINIVGEPIIKKMLMQIYNDVFESEEDYFIKYFRNLETDKKKELMEQLERVQ